MFYSTVLLNTVNFNGHVSGIQRCVINIEMKFIYLWAILKLCNIRFKPSATNLIIV